MNEQERALRQEEKKVLAVRISSLKGKLKAAESAMKKLNKALNPSLMSRMLAWIFGK